MRRKGKKRSLTLLVTVAVQPTTVTPAFTQMPNGDKIVPADTR